MEPAAEHRLMLIVELTVEAAAMNDAALAGDLEEARFRAQRIVSRARAETLCAVADAAQEVVSRLGTSGSAPRPGYGAAMLGLAQALTP